MIIRAAIALTFAGWSMAAQAEQAFEIVQFEIAGNLPAGFALAQGNQPFDGWDYRSDDEQAQLTVWGRNELRGGLREEYAMAVQNLGELGFHVRQQNLGEDHFAISYTDANGWLNSRYSSFGEDCSGADVMASFVSRHHTESRTAHQPMIPTIRDSMVIGACG